MAQALQNGQEYNGHEIVIERPDGSRWHAMAYANPFHDESGQVIGAVNVLVDISDQKRAEIARSELAAIVESSDDAIISKNLEGIITSWNRAAEKMYGYAAEEVVGRPISLIIPSDMPNELPDIIERLKRGEKIEHYETVRVRKDGSRVDVSLTISPVKNAEGKVIGVSKTARDITARKQAEAAVAKHNERVRLLWEAAAVLLATDDPHAMLRELFATISQHLGVDTYFNYVMESTGDALRLASYIGISTETAHSVERLELGQGICGTVAQRRRPIVATFIQQSDDPKAKLVKSFGIRAYACNPLLAGNLLIGTLSFASRTKDEFHAEELTFLETITHYVTLAHERLRLIKQLQQTDRRKDEFLATLAHELRNPLAPIRNAAELMRQADGNGSLIQQASSMMERQLGQMGRLIDDLLDVSRITTAKMRLHRERVELTTVVQSAVEASRSIIESLDHELTVTLPKRTTLDADPTRLAQVISNLLNNAAKYTEKGGHIWLTAERQDGEVVVSVRDTGIGIAAEHLPHIFKMFSQVTTASERSQDGLGIGLSLVRGLVELHGGSITARSDGIGKGSEFVVRLPVVDVPVQAPQNPTCNGDSSHCPSQCRILVVDDNRDAANSLGLLLRLMGHDIHTAHDGLEAVKAAATHRPDVVLLDIGLPRMNGYEAARCIREEPWGTNMILIALTGWGQEEDRRRSKEAGFNHHLVKPVEPAALQKLLADLQPATA